MRKIILITILLFLLIPIGIQVLAQDAELPSPGLLPDNLFYFLKVWKEQIQLFFTFGLENKARQHLHLADVRLAEYQKMIEKEKVEIAQKTLEKYEKQLNHAFQKAEELKNRGEDIRDLSQKIEDSVVKHITVLERNLQKAPEAAKKGLEAALEASRKRIQKKMEKDTLSIWPDVESFDLTNKTFEGKIWFKDQRIKVLTTDSTKIYQTINQEIPNWKDTYYTFPEFYSLIKNWIGPAWKFTVKGVLEEEGIIKADEVFYYIQ